MATVTVTINGVEYNLKGHEDGEYLKKVAEYVEEKTQEMATKNNKLSALGVLSLSALNIADELFKGNDEYNQLIDYYEKVKSELEKSKKEIEDETDDRQEEEHQNPCHRLHRIPVVQYHDKDCSQNNGEINHVKGHRTYLVENSNVCHNPRF